MDPTRPTTRHHGPSPSLPSLRSLRNEQLRRPDHAPAPEAGYRIDYAALRRRQAQARAASIDAWRDRCDAVLRKPKAPGCVEPPLDSYVEKTDGGTPYARATDEYRIWFGRTYVVDVDTVEKQARRTVQPDPSDGRGELAF